MYRRIATLVATAAMLMGVMAACSSSPSSPTGQSSVAGPRQVSPAPGVTIRNVDQPVTLSVTNALVTQSGTATYTFEVATDTNFSNKVQNKTGIAQGASGQTTVRLDNLAPATDYYWRARADADGTIGVYTQPYKFTVGPAVTLNAPTLLAPAANAQTDARPTFTVNNATRTGPAGAVTYRFEVAVNPAFNPLVIDTTVAESSSGRTSLQIQRPAELPAETTIYWRVTATDATNAVSSPASQAASFVTALAIDLRRAVFLNSPDVSTWPETGTLELVIQDGNAAAGGPFCTRFTDPGWPDSPWPYGGPDPNFGVFANQWYFAKINGTWYGGAGEWIYRGAGTCKAGQGTRTIGPDSGFGEPFASWVPRPGELFGTMISSVARRGSVRRTVDERTNIIVQPWRDTSLGSTLVQPGQPAPPVPAAFGFRQP